MKFFSNKLITLELLAILLVNPVSVQALTRSATATKSSTLVQTRISDLKARADREIVRRTTALTLLITRLNNFKRLPDKDREEFKKAIQDEIKALNELKSKIDAETDLTMLKADVQSIVSSYRIFALFIPKIHLLAAADTMLTISDNLTALADRLQTAINIAKTKGNETTSLEADLKIINDKIADAKKQANAVDSIVLPLTPDGYPGNKSILNNARSMIKNGHEDLVDAKHLAEKIVLALKAFNKTATSSATVK
jgi:hypothetical protein